jgi:hypothetical protein
MQPAITWERNLHDKMSTQTFQQTTEIALISNSNFELEQNTKRTQGGTKKCFKKKKCH